LDNSLERAVIAGAGSGGSEALTQFSPTKFAGPSLPPTRFSVFQAQGVFASRSSQVLRATVGGLRFEHEAPRVRSSNPAGW
jgi:hypothetical protein